MMSTKPQAMDENGKILENPEILEHPPQEDESADDESQEDSLITSGEPE